MGETVCLNGSANGIAPYTNGTPMANGVSSTTSVMGNGVASYPSKPAETNGVLHLNSERINGVVPHLNGTAPNGVPTTNSMTVNGSIHCVASNGTNGTVPTNGPNGTLSLTGKNGVLTGNASPDGFGKGRRTCFWYEEEIEESLRWCFGLTSILHTGASEYQDIALLDTQPFGKVLILDGKIQSAEVDEWVYHECLVHPALLYHSSPKNVFIMGGGEGSTAREALRHRSVRKVVMCDIDKEVVAFCATYLTVNRDAFHSSRLELVISDARAQLENREDRFDVIIGDLADPMEGGPCYQLYSKGFYENVVKPKLNPGGIFVTQAGPAGVLTHGEVFSSIYNTMRHVFSYVVAYTAHVPSYADTWGWVMASDQPLGQISADELDNRMKQRVKGELRYLDGATLLASTVLNKTVRRALARETHVYTEDSARFVYGHGRGTNQH